jgi:hypothetical protein
MQLVAPVEPAEVAREFATRYARLALAVEREVDGRRRFPMTIAADLSRTS